MLHGSHLEGQGSSELSYREKCEQWGKILSCQKERILLLEQDNMLQKALRGVGLQGTVLRRPCMAEGSRGQGWGLGGRCKSEGRVWPPPAFMWGVEAAHHENTL